MQAGRRWLLVGVLVMVGLVGGACGGETGRDEPGVARPSTTEVPARVEPTTSAPPPATTPTTITTTVVPVTEPADDEGRPRLTVTPARAPAGTRVDVAGSGFNGRWHGDAQLWLSDRRDQSECGLLAEVEHDFRFSADGFVVGSFVVPAQGLCRVGQGPVVTLGAGDFDIMFRCSTDCRVGRFSVILPGESAEEPTGTECDVTINFGGGENIAGDIYADGLSCADAESFLRAYAPPLGPINGLAHIDADGFSCDRTGQSDVHLPRANYKCTRGSQSIFFIRT